MLSCSGCNRAISKEEFQSAMRDITRNGDNSKNITYDCPHCGHENKIII